MTTNEELRATPADDTRWSLPKTAIYAILLGVLVLATAYSSIQLTRPTGRIAAIWIPNAIVLAALIRGPSRGAHAVLSLGFVGNFISDALVGDEYLLALGLSLCNTAEVAIAWVALRLGLPGSANREIDLSNPRTLSIFIVACGGFAPAAAATLASTILHLTTGASLAATWAIWFMADALGMLSIAPVLLSFSRDTVEVTLVKRHRGQDAIVIVAAVAASLIAFAGDVHALVFLVIPIVLLPAFRIGFAGAALTCCLVSLVAIAATSLGYGPFESMPGVAEREQVFLLQAFVLTIVLIALPVAAGLTYRRRIEAELAQSRKDLTRIIDSMPAMIASWDRTLHNRFCNRAYIEWFGKSPDEIMTGMHIKDVIGPKLFELNRGYMAAALQGETQTFEREIVDATGRRRISQAYYIPDVRNGKIEGFYVLVFDISRLKEIELAVQIARDQAESANRAKTTFLSTMSHELRTPLNSILGFTDMVAMGLAGPINEKQAEYLTNAKTSAQHLLHLISDILEISMIESGKVSVTSESIAVGPLVKTVIAGLEALAKKANINVMDQIGNIPPVVADSTRLCQALINLGSNAIKYNQPGGRVGFSAERIGQGMVRIKVSDTGRGIAAARQSELFREFSRLGAEGSAIEGIGIGLALTRRLVEAMHGSIGFASIEGKGSEFWVDLPIAPNDEYDP